MARAQSDCEYSTANVIEYNSNYHEVSAEPEPAYYSAAALPFEANPDYHQASGQRDYSMAGDYEITSAAPPATYSTAHQLSEANPDYHQVSTEVCAIIFSILTLFL